MHFTVIPLIITVITIIIENETENGWLVGWLWFNVTFRDISAI